MANDNPYLTITLTDSRPVKIKKEDWEIIAEATAGDYDNEHEFQANRKSNLAIRVRQHIGDGQTIIYGTYSYSTQFQNERDRSIRTGEMIRVEGAEAPSYGNLDPVIDAIKRVAANLAERIGADHFGLDAIEVGNQCIADLPAEELV